MTDDKNEKGLHTHTHARHSRFQIVENRYHMPTFSHRALKTGVERIAGEQRQQSWLICILRM